MKTRRIAAALALWAGAAWGQELLDNTAIGKMVNSGLGEQAIVTLINERPGLYAVTADDLIALRKAGISERILAAMIVRAGPAPAASKPAVPSQMVLEDGAPIRLRLMRAVNFNTVRPGDTVHFEVMDDLRLDGLLVTAHGMRAEGTVTQAEPKTRMGRGGKLGVSVATIPLLNGDRLRVRVMRAARSETGEAADSTLFTLAKTDDFPEGKECTVYADGEARLDPGRFLVDVPFASNPQGALVTMYGTPVGRTPFTARLAPGVYKVIFSLNGFYDLTESVTVGPGRENAGYGAFVK